MSPQADYVVSNGTGAAVRSDFNGQLAAIVSNNSGATEPGTMYAYQWWADTTTGLLKLRNSANSAWISLRELDGTLTIEDGTAAAPGLAFTSDLNTGLFRVGSDQVAISTGGTSRLAVSTTAVSSTLAVDVPLGAVGTPSLTFTGDLNTGIYSPGADTVAFVTAGSNRVHITSGGLVGINTTSPSQPLEVAGNARVNGVVCLNNAPSAWSSAKAFEGHYGGSLSFDEGFSYTTLASNSFYDGSNWKYKISVGASRYSLGDLASGGTGTHQWFRAASGTAGNTISWLESMRLDGSGRLLVGTSSTSSSLPKLILSGGADGGVTGGVLVANPEATPTDAMALGFYDFSAANHSTAARILARRDGGTWTAGSSQPTRLEFSTTADGGSSPTTSPSAMTINSGQEVLIGYSTDNGAYKLQVNSQIFATSATIATSDGRYKENVATLDDCVDLVKALRPVSFDWKHQEPITRINEEGKTVVVREAHNFPDGTQVGFIAQEVQEVLAEKPWLTSVIKQNVRPAVNDSDGNELAPEEEFFGIAEGNLVAVLTSALQEAIAKIEALETRLSALEAA